MTTFLYAAAHTAACFVVAVLVALLLPRGRQPNPVAKVARRQTRWRVTFPDRVESFDSLADAERAMDMEELRRGINH